MTERDWIETGLYLWCGLWVLILVYGYIGKFYHWIKLTPQQRDFAERLKREHREYDAAKPFIDRIINGR